MLSRILRWKSREIRLWRVCRLRRRQRCLCDRLHSLQQAIKELELGAASDEDGSIQYLLARLYRKSGDIKAAQNALDRMKAIREKRRERGYKFVQDPELSAMESSDQPSAP